MNKSEQYLKYTNESERYCNMHILQAGWPDLGYFLKGQEIFGWEYGSLSSEGGNVDVWDFKIELFMNILSKVLDWQLFGVLFTKFGQIFFQFSGHTDYKI